MKQWISMGIFTWIGNFITACTNYLEDKILTGKFVTDINHPAPKYQPQTEKKKENETEKEKQVTKKSSPSSTTILLNKIMRISLVETTVWISVTTIRILTVHYVDLLFIFMITFSLVLILFSFFQTSLNLFFVLLLPFVTIIVYCLSAYYFALSKKMSGETTTLWQGFARVTNRFFLLSLPFLTQIAVILVSGVCVFLIAFLFTYLYDFIRIPWEGAYTYWLFALSLGALWIIGVVLLIIVMNQAYFAMLLQNMSFQKAIDTGFGKVKDHPFLFFFFYGIFYFIYLNLSWQMTLSYLYLGFAMSIFFTAALGLFLGYLLDRKFSMTHPANLPAEKPNHTFRNICIIIFGLGLINYCLLSVFFVKQHATILTFIMKQQENANSDTLYQYANNAYRYTIAYPPNWTRYERENNTVSFYNNYTGNIKDGTWYSVSVNKFNASFFTKLANAHPGIVQIDKSSKAITTKVSNTTVQNYETVMYISVKPQETYTQYETHYLIHKGDYSYDVAFVTLSNDIDGFDSTFFEKIISTLQFID